MNWELEVYGREEKENESHYVETYSARHFDNTVEVWCPNIDETKVVLGHRYVRHCPMCGDEIEGAVERP